MKRFSRTIALVLVTVFIAAFALGCASSKNAATVGDRKVTVAQLQNVYSSYSQYASLYGYDTSTAEGRLAFLEYLLDQQLAAVVQAYQAEKAGVVLTDEEKAQAAESAAADYDSFIKQFDDYAEQAGASDKKAYANKILAETLSKNGKTLSEMKKDFLREEEDTLLANKYKEQLLAEVALSDENLLKLYEEEVETQKKELAEDPSYYFTMDMYYAYGYTYMPLFVPEGFFYVRHILTEDEETANEVLKKIQNGEDFEALLEEYNTDPGMGTNPEGYLIGEGANFVEEFLNAALALENEGDVSPVVQSEHGYHIIKRMADAESRVIPYEEVKDSFDALATSRHESEYYNGLIEGWIADESVVKYPSNYKSIAD